MKIKIKFNWGFKIAAFYIGFLLFWVFLVYWSFSQDVNLVADDYYQQEIKFQEQINKENRTKNLLEQPAIKLNNSDIEISFPESFPPKEISGQIHIYRPSSFKYDEFIDLKLNSAGKQFIPTNNLLKGLWKVKLDWNFTGIDYFNRKIIMIK